MAFSQATTTTTTTRTNFERSAKKEYHYLVCHVVEHFRWKTRKYIGIYFALLSRYAKKNCNFPFVSIHLPIRLWCHSKWRHERDTRKKIRFGFYFIFILFADKFSLNSCCISILYLGGNALETSVRVREPEPPRRHDLALRVQINILKNSNLFPAKTHKKHRLSMVYGLVSVRRQNNAKGELVSAANGEVIWCITV